MCDFPSYSKRFFETSQFFYRQFIGNEMILLKIKVIYVTLPRKVPQKYAFILFITLFFISVLCLMFRLCQKSRFRLLKVFGLML